MWPQNSIGMKETIKLIINDDGKPIQHITRIFKMKDGCERQIISLEEL